MSRSSFSEIWSELRAGQGPGARVGRGAGAAFGIKVAGTALVLLNQLALTHILGVDSYGQYIYTITWISLLTVVGVIGMDTTVVRFVGQYGALGERRLLRGLLARGASWSVGASLLLGAIAAGVATLLSGSMEDGLHAALLAGAALLPVQVAVQYWSAVARGYQRIVLAKLPQEVLRPLLFGTTMVALFFIFGARPGAAAAVGWNLAATVVVLIVLVGGLRPSLRELGRVAPRSASREWLSVAGPVLLIAGSQLLLSRTDTLMLGILRDTSEAGIYAIASRIAGLVSFMLVAVAAIAAPMISECHARQDRRRLKRLLSVASRIVLAYALPAAIGLVLAGRWLLGWFGEEFAAAYGVLVILVAGQLVHAFCGLVGALLVMTGHQSSAARILWTAVVINVVLNAVLIPRFGAPGAAVATTTAMVLRHVWMLVTVIRRLELDPTPFAALGKNER